MTQHPHPLPRKEISSFLLSFATPLESEEGKRKWQGICLQELPDTERPRERLLEHGPHVLSLAELIAIILGTGTKGKSVLDLAEEIVSHFDGLQGLLEASVAEFMEIKGVGKAKAIQLKAAFAIAARSQKPDFLEKKRALRTAKQAFEVARYEMSYCKQEMLLVILKDARERYLLSERVSIGTLSEVLFHPREVFYPAVRHKAHSIIVAHNHPSGDPTPSAADLAITSRLLHCGRVMDILVDDHLILGGGTFVSLKETGYFKRLLEGMNL